MASVRREVIIERPADVVWQQIGGDPTAMARWFPGVVSASLEEPGDGEIRRISTVRGFEIPEAIVLNDAVLRRFQYRIVAPMFREHLATVDVIALDEQRSMVIYGTDAEPGVFALVIGGAAGEGINELKRQLESSN